MAAAEPVTLDTFVRAESDTAIRGIYDRGGLGKFFHFRAPTPIEDQPIIRMNRDTLYSSAVLDLSSPATITLPDTGGRYMSLQVVSEDHYMLTYSEPGDIELTEEMVGSRYALLAVRTFINADDPEDIARANIQQDGLKIQGGGNTFDLPGWDQDQLLAMRQAVNALAPFGLDFSRAFGTKDEVDPIQYFVGAGVGWGGLPSTSAVYKFANVENNDASPYTLTVGDVPVDAFWSVTVYNAKGYIDENDLGVYSYNNVTAKPNDDGTVTLNFGGCEDGRVNCLPVSQGWNYAVRLYQPRLEILDGSWTFPEAEAVK